ncbi:MAG: hypothetical protein IPM56_15485 [Ignavibacteriales bacterium]|nr:MAG: hypothetical protein IPM56_15485 [Ignavibacteriales bacterium]
MKKIKMYLSITLLTIAAGCSTATLINEAEKSVLLEHNIITGTGGGFSGYYEGYDIDVVGNVNHWQGISYDRAKRIYVGSLGTTQIEKINSLISESDILNTQYDGKGNITTFITLKDSSKAHRISWAGISPDRKVPESIRDFNSRLNEIITINSNY